MRENDLCLYGHVQKRSKNALIRGEEDLKFEEPRRGTIRHKLTWITRLQYSKKNWNL